MRIDSDALERLVEGAKAAHSDTLVVLQRDELVGEWYFGLPKRPIELMSCTKSVVAVVMAHLLEQGLIQGWDQPVADFFPEWRQGQKRTITLRHLMNHTSGMQNERITHVEIYPAPNVVQLALCAELSGPPGEKFEYNNKAVNLLAGVVQRASGKPLDIYCAEHLFPPLEIAPYEWYKDAVGNPHAMAGLALQARDFAKFGQLIVNRGSWNSWPLIAPEIVDSLLEQGQPHVRSCGLLWWRWFSKDRLIGYSANGYLGQYLLIVPERHLVVVRQVDWFEGYNELTDGFDGLFELVEAL